MAASNEFTSTPTSIYKEHRVRAVSSYFEGTLRAPYSSPNLAKSLSDCSLDVSPETTQPPRAKTCSLCPPILIRLAKTFEALGSHGKEKRRRQKSYPNPKKAGKHYRNLSAENNWIRENLFDSQVSYNTYNQCAHRISRALVLLIFFFLQTAFILFFCRETTATATTVY